MAPEKRFGEIPLGAYIFLRLKSLGIHHIFGCPGDFNLNFLDHLETVGGIKWVGTCNELNAAYAADGYSRIRGLPGVLVTTYGVGELSAINGVSGAYSEHVPIIHIVGTTSRLAQKDRIMIHHTLNENWDHTTFQKMSEPVRVDSAFLTNDEAFTDDIDRVLESAIKYRRPVYLFIPMDVPDLLVDASPLSTALQVEIQSTCSESTEDIVVDLIFDSLKSAQKPCILLDVLTQRYGVLEEAQQIIRDLGIPVYTTPLAKSFVDETSAEYQGLYNGSLSPSEAVQKSVELSDVIVHIGPLLSDSNTGGWSQTLPVQNLITLHPSYVRCRGKTWEDVHFVPVIKKLAARVLQDKGTERVVKKRFTDTEAEPSSPSGPLEQHHFWRQWSPFLEPGDLVIAEVGSAQYGTLELKLPAGAEFFTQLYYSCIGFTVGALLGAMVARRENGKTGRAILFVGDGSLQMTVQELGTIIRCGFNPIIVVINNSGYTIERIIHGPIQGYNNISETWDHQNMLKFFGATKSTSCAARTYEELATVLADPSFQHSSQPRLLEVFMDKFDAPWMLTAQVNRVQKRSAAQLAACDKETGRRRRVLDTNLYQSKYALRDSPSNVYLAQRYGD